jgi:DNA-binding CsgD family transcriptional regulator
MDRFLFELVDGLDRIGTEYKGVELLSQIARKFDLRHVAYLGLNLPNTRPHEPYIITTYSDQWVQRYQSENYVTIDPVINDGLSGVLPLDWNDVRDKSKKVRSFFAEAEQFGVARQGLSFPIRGAHGEAAMFSINADVSDRDWEHEKLRLLRECQILAFHFHTRILEDLGISLPEDTRLYPRERECLIWASAGKSAADTATILGISERTVRYYLENARVKLGTVNTVQTVAKAIRLRLI